jgi:hypothetical protein
MAAAILQGGGRAILLEPDHQLFTQEREGCGPSFNCVMGMSAYQNLRRTFC